MTTLKDLYLKISNGYYSIDEAIEFVDLAARTLEPEKPYNSDFTIVVAQNGFIEPILKAALKAVENNPKKVGFQVCKTYSKPSSYNIGIEPRTLLKIEAYDY